MKTRLLTSGIRFLAVLLILFAGSVSQKSFGQTQLVKYSFENNLTADAAPAPIGSPVLTYSATQAYATGATGQGLSVTSNNSFLELTMSTAGYSSITVQWAGKTNSTSGGFGGNWLLAVNSGTGYGSTIFTETMTTSYATIALQTLSSAFNNNSTIKIKITANTGGFRTLGIDNLIVSGTLIQPTLTATPAIAFGNITTGTSSSVQSFNLSGTALTGAPGNITITSPLADFQVSNAIGGPFGSTATIPYSGSTLASTPVYVIFSPSSTGAQSGNITFSGGGVATPPNEAISGTGVGAFSQLIVLLPGESLAPNTVSGKTGTAATQTAGTAFTVTVDAVDANFNLINSAPADNVQITSTDGNAALPATAALASGTKTFSVTLKTAGTQTVTATDATNGAITPSTSSNITVNPGALSKFSISPVPDPEMVGTPFSVTITALDANNNTVTSFTGTTAMTTNAGVVSPATSSAFVAGVLTQSFSVSTTGSNKTITATNTGKSGTSNTFTVTPGAFSKLQILLPGETAAPGTTTGKTGTPSARVAGVAFNVTVNAVDASWNVISSAPADNIQITSTDGQAALPASNTLASGTEVFSVTLKTSGVQMITATDADNGTITPNTSPNVTVNAAAAASFVFSAIASPQQAGVTFSITITAKDAFNNTATSYSGTGTSAALTTTDGTITPTTSGNFTTGVRTVTVSVSGVGTAQTITATSGAITGTSNAFDVSVGPLNSFKILASGGGAIGTQASGTPFNVQITAVDAGGNTVTTFNSTVALTASANFIISPSTSAAFTNGVLSSQAVTLTGNSTGVTITATVTGPTKSGASSPFGVTADWYTKTTAGENVTAAATWTSDPSGVGGTNLPNASMFTSGNGTFHIQNTTGAVTDPTNTWTISGTGSRVILGDGTNPVNFTVQSVTNTAFTGTINIAANATLTQQDDVPPTFGTIDPNSTVNYNKNGGTLPQTIAAATYGNLIISPITGITTSLTGATTVTGNFTFNGAGTFDVTTSNFALNVKGNWTRNAGGTFTARNGVVTFNGTSQQIVGGAGTATTAFANVTIASGSTTTVGLNNTVTGSLNIASGGVLDLSAFTFNRASSGAGLTVAGTLRLSGTSNFPTNFTGPTMSGGTVEYYGATQTIFSSVTYNNLVISTAGVKSLTSATSAITGNLTVNPAATLDISTFALNKSGAAGTLTLGSGSLLRLKGTTGGITGSNFPSNLVPTLDPASTVEYYGTSHQTVANVVSGYGSLTVNNAAGVDLPNDQTVAGALNFVAGKLDATAATLTLSSATPVINGASASSYIITDNGTFEGNLTVSNVPAGSFQFPIGTSSLYMPATVNPSTSTSWTANVFTPASTDGSYGGTQFTGTALNAIVNSIWTITPASGTTADLTLNWDASLEGSQFQLYADNQIGISHYNAGAGAFDPAIQTSASHTGHTVTANFSAFSPFGIGFINDPLPVILVDFNAVLNSDKTVGLSWSTQQEVNSSHFDVLRSTDGSTWVSIGTVEAKGNASFVSNYAFTDKSPASGINYYRLKMVDIDGKFGYSNIRVIRTTSFSGISVFPNPARDYVNVSIGGSSSPKTIRLISQNGQVMQIKSVNSTTGTTISMNVHNYVQGTYYLQIIGTDGTNQTTKVVIER